MMTTEGLLALRGSVIVGVQGADSFSIIDLVRAKKEASGIVDDISKDTNDDGVVDISDINNIKKILLGLPLA